jgi:hypothetical protein
LYRLPGRRVEGGGGGASNSLKFEQRGLERAGAATSSFWAAEQLDRVGGSIRAPKCISTACASTSRHAQLAHLADLRVVRSSSDSHLLSRAGCEHTVDTLCGDDSSGARALIALFFGCINGKHAHASGTVARADR